MRAAIVIGPEYGTVGADLVREAARECRDWADAVVVCGFAFDPHVSEEAKRNGRLTVLVTRMNPDLSMGDELLKKTGAGNLFMVFGEPDITITTEGTDGYLTVEVKGVDVYDPTTGQIRNSSTDDIACWFIDTDYNGESFFVRHAYFLGANDPYKSLKTALKAEIDEDAWRMGSCRKKSVCSSDRTTRWVGPGRPSQRQAQRRSRSPAMARRDPARSPSGPCTSRRGSSSRRSP